MSHRKPPPSDKDPESGVPLLKYNASANEYDIIGLAALVVLHFTEGALLVNNKEYAPAIVAIVIGLFALVATSIAYIYRIYTRYPDAGKTIVAVALGGIFVGQFILGIWKLVLACMHL